MQDLMPTAPDMPQELSDGARTELESLVTGVLKDEMSARRSEVRIAARQRFFRNGIQHVWYDSASYSYMAPDASGLELPRFMDVYNIFTPHWRSFVSILSQNPPGVNFVPDDLQRSPDVSAAASAEKMRKRVDRLVHMKDRQAEAAGYFCTDGRTITRTTTDAQGKLRITLHGVLESKVPIFARKMERWGYAVLSEEIDLWEAKDEYPDFASDIESADTSTAEASFERTARLGILANRKSGAAYGEAHKGLVTQHVAWIRPSRYRKASDEVRRELKALYPNGVRCTMISGKAVECVGQSMEEELRVEWPSPGQGQNRPSLLHDLVPIQEAFNDCMNMLREHFEFSIPATWIAEGSVDSEALSEQRSAPGVIHTITVPSGASINDLIMQEQVAQLPPELVSNIDRLLSLAQFISGDLPSLSGEGDPHSETAEGQKMLSDQAKGQLSPAWAGIQWLFAGTYEIAIKKAAELVSDRESIAISGGPTGQQRFNPAAILDGTWGCYPDTDSSFPETMADKRASFSMLTQRLGAAGEAGLAIVMHPDNLKLAKQYSGLDDFIIIQAEARDKQLMEIEQLLQESPVPDESQMPQYMQMTQQAQAQGQQPPPPPMKSSVDVDADWDFHQYELDKLQEWLSSTACREEQQKGNIPGIQNVKLHGAAHKAALAKIAQNNAPKPEPPKISLSVKVDDPSSVSQILGLAGVNTQPADIEAANVTDEQKTVAETQNQAASAMHKSVLAAKEQVTPIKRDTPPDQIDKIEEK